MTSETPRVPRSALYLIFAITCLNTLGMTIVIPITPFLTQHYVQGAGAVAIWVGILGSAFAACSFLAAPALGSLSDRVGRKPVLVASVLGSAVGFVVFGIGGAIWVLLLGRIIDGLTGGNISTIFAYLADITPPEQRASNFGLAGAISGFGFMIGPAIGGMLSTYGIAVPAFVAAGVSLVAALIAFFVLPESLAAEHRTAHFSLGDLHPLRKITEALSHTTLRPILLLTLAMTIPMAGLQSNIGVFGLDALGWGPATIGWFLLGVGVLDIIVQGGLVRFLSPRIGERAVVFVGILGQAVGYLIIAVVARFTTPWLFIFGGLLFAASEGGTGPALSALASRMVSHREQGWLMGGMQSMSSVARAIGPLIAGALYFSVGRPAPYVFGLVVLIGVLVLGGGVLRPTPSLAEEPA